MPEILIYTDQPSKADESGVGAFNGFAGLELAKVLGKVGLSQDCYHGLHILPMRRAEWELAAMVPKTAKGQKNGTGRIRGVPVAIELQHAWEQVQQEILTLKPKIIVATGELALFVLTGNQGIGRWRGSTLQVTIEDLTVTVIPTYPLEMLMVREQWRVDVERDFLRVKHCIFPINSPAPVNFLDLYPKPPKRKEVIRSVSALTQLIGFLAFSGDLIAVDIETRAGHIACLGLTLSPTWAICIPFMQAEGDPNYWSEEDEIRVIATLQKILQSKSCVFQNGLYDCQYIQTHWGFVPNVAWDTMLAQHVLHPGMPKRLDYLASHYCDDYVYWKDDGKTWDKEMDEEQLWLYNCDDCLYTLEIARKQREIFQSSAARLFPAYQFQLSLFIPVLRTMLTGFKADKAEKTRLVKMLGKGSEAGLAALEDVLGHSFNPRSSKQMKDLFYIDMGQKAIRKQGVETLNDAALHTLATKEPLLRGVIQLICEYRSLALYKKTFGESEVDPDGRFRTSFDIAGTETFRFSSRKNVFDRGLNFQNVPSGGEIDDGVLQLTLPNMRKMFIPDEGHILFDSDLGSADLRIVVWESNCKGMKELFAAGLDPYTEIAKEYYHDPAMSKSDPRRKLFKIIAHGTNYLGKPRALAGNTGLLMSEIEAVQKWYFAKFPEIKKWQDNLCRTLDETQTVRNIWGYEYKFHTKIQGNVYNQAVAWVPQSSIGILINKVYVRIDNEIPEIDILSQVHDSLVGQAPIEDWPSIFPRLQALSSVPLPYSDPLIIPMGFKTSEISWGDCK